jgi:hypothetical protein
MTLCALLGRLVEQDLSGMKRFAKGEWSRQNFQAIIDDIKDKARN